MAKPATPLDPLKQQIRDDLIAREGALWDKIKTEIEKKNLAAIQANVAAQQAFLGKNRHFKVVDLLNNPSNVTNTTLSQALADLPNQFQVETGAQILKHIRFHRKQDGQIDMVPTEGAKFIGFGLSAKNGGPKSDKEFLDIAKAMILILKSKPGTLGIEISGIEDPKRIKMLAELIKAEGLEVSLGGHSAKVVREGEKYGDRLQQVISNDVATEIELLVQTSQVNRQPRLDAAEKEREKERAAEVGAPSATTPGLVTALDTSVQALEAAKTQLEADIKANPATAPTGAQLTAYSAAAKAVETSMQALKLEDPDQVKLMTEKELKTVSGLGERVATALNTSSMRINLATNNPNLPAATTAFTDTAKIASNTDFLKSCADEVLNIRVNGPRRQTP